MIRNDTPETDAFAEEEQVGTKSVWELYTLCRKLERERDELKDVIRRAKVEFFKDGEDGNVCVRMLEIIQEAK